MRLNILGCLLIIYEMILAYAGYIDTFWGNVILSPSSLRKHYDTMKAQKVKPRTTNGANKLQNTGSDEYDDLPI